MYLVLVLDFGVMLEVLGRNGEREGPTGETSATHLAILVEHLASLA